MRCRWHTTRSARWVLPRCTEVGQAGAPLLGGGPRGWLLRAACQPWPRSTHAASGTARRARQQLAPPCSPGDASTLAWAGRVSRSLSWRTAHPQVYYVGRATGVTPTHITCTYTHFPVRLPSTVGRVSGLIWLCKIASCQAKPPRASNLLLRMPALRMSARNSCHCCPAGHAAGDAAAQQRAAVARHARPGCLEL